MYTGKFIHVLEVMYGGQSVLWGDEEEGNQDKR